MKSLDIFVILSLLIVLADSQICPVLEGEWINSTSRVSFNSNDFKKEFDWINMNGNFLTNVSTCDLNNDCSLSTTRSYTFTMTQRNVPNSTSNLTISTAGLIDEGSWLSSAAALTRDGSTFDLNVFDRSDIVLESCHQDYIKEGTTASCSTEKNNSFINADLRCFGSPGSFRMRRQVPRLISLSLSSRNRFETLNLHRSYMRLGYNNLKQIFHLEMSKMEFDINIQLNMTMACQDSGIYVYKAQTQENEVKETMKIYVLCKQQFAPTESHNKVYHIQANQMFDINITVFDYPEPQLAIQSATALKEGTYNLVYYTTTQGNSVVNLKIYTVLEAYFQKYELSVKNTQGSFVYSFVIKPAGLKHLRNVTAQVDGSAGSNVGAILGGIAVGIVIVFVGVVVYIAWRKGLFSKSINQENSPAFKYTAGDHGENCPHSRDSDQMSSLYAEIDDTQSVTNYDFTENDAQNTDSQKYIEVKTVEGRPSIRGTTNMREAQPHDEAKTLADSSSCGSTTNLKVVWPHSD